jgi:Salmonella outer protein D
MPVNLNTANGAYSVNTSRIEKFMTAANREDALQMGGWDRFKDFFKADNDKKATKIAHIYDSIVNDASGNQAPMTMLDRFHALKAMAASPEYRALFRTTYTPPNTNQGVSGNSWGYAFEIAGETIHQKSGLQTATNRTADDTVFNSQAARSVEFDFRT